MRLAVLGPLTLAGTDGEVSVTPRKARELLTLLALEHPRPVSLEAMSDELWDNAPAAATKTIQAHLSRLRGALVAAGAHAPGIGGGPAGYRLTELAAIDLHEVNAAARSGRRALQAGVWTVAIDGLHQARTLFRGEPELPATAAGTAHRRWVQELKSSLDEDYLEALIHAGHIGAALGELELLTIAQPLRERLWELRMIALAGAGRGVEAIRAFAELRTLLVEHIGVEPAERLRRAEAEILAGRVPTMSARPRPEGRPASTAGAEIQEPGTVRYVKVDDAHIAYCSVGEGSPDIVILNPGTLGADSVLREPRFADAVRRLAANWRVTWFDRRGIGLSDRCTVDRLPTVSDWVRDTIGVLDAVDASPVFLLATEDTVPVAFQLAVEHVHRVAGIVLANAYARFTRAEDYPYGLDPLLAEQSAAEMAAADPVEGGFDPLRVIAPSVAHDDRFRAWWNDSGRRGASPQVARALRSRQQNTDVRTLVARVQVPVLHFVNPTALAYDAGHGKYLEAHLADIETVELPGPDEFWWLDTSGTFYERLRRFIGSR